MSILSVPQGRCRECYACIRACPVKAVKMADGQVDIIEERCVYCGRCTVACPGSSLELGDIGAAYGFLAEGRRTVAILAPEYPASFYPMSSEQLAFLIELAGFYGHEDTVLGEELVARQYLRHFAAGHDFPVIRSTCPAAITWVEKYYPDLSDYLAPVVSPMVAQASLVKSLYGDDVAVVYATPCIAAKYEARAYNAVDAVLTFKEFKTLLISRITRPGSEMFLKGMPKPQLRRRYSVPGGFPRPTIAQHNMLDPTLMVLRGVSDLEGLAKAIYAGDVRAKFIDLLVCNGCIDGPGMDTDLSLFARKGVAARDYQNSLVKASKQLTFDQLEPYLPRIETLRSFANRQINLPVPSEEAIREILAEGEKFTREDELDCGACGYKTCREQAIAIYQGVADWNMCFPFQRKVYNRIIAQLKETSVTDGLTGLYNHKSFLERLAVEFNRAERYGHNLSLMMIDVDTFKEINDTYGHVTGDAVLKAIAATIKGNIRQSDLAARYGGDEFALILPETNLEKAFHVGEKLRRRVETNPIELKPDILIKVTLSIGVGSFSPDMGDPLALVKKADEALYLAKEAGRNKTMASESLS